MSAISFRFASKPKACAIATRRKNPRMRMTPIHPDKEDRDALEKRRATLGQPGENLPLDDRAADSGTGHHRPGDGRAAEEAQHHSYLQLPQIDWHHYSRS